MENNSEVEVVSPPSAWQKLLRQNSEKIGSFAEDVVLPKNQRSGQQTAVPEVLLLRDVESQDVCMSEMVIESPIKRRQKKFPFFIVGISIVQITIWFKVPDMSMLLVFGYDPHRRHEIWRFITVMFVHIGYVHMWSNVIFQLILGVPLEIVHHWKRIAIIYCSSVLGGSLILSVVDPSRYGAGASGAVYGLLFSHLSTIIINWSEMDRKYCRLSWLLIYIFYDIGLSIYGELDLKERSDTSHAAHAGGAITGFLVSILALKNFEKHPWERKMEKICLRVLQTLGVIIVLVNICAWGLYLPTYWNFNYIQISELYLKCYPDPECKLMLDQYILNGTKENE